MFKDERGIVYALAPRLEDQKIEDILVTEQIIVDALIWRDKSQTEKIYAMAGLQLLK